MTEAAEDGSVGSDMDGVTEIGGGTLMNILHHANHVVVRRRSDSDSSESDMGWI